jgi:tetratricopeptide (TPR) repeat protein
MDSQPQRLIGLAILAGMIMAACSSPAPETHEGSTADVEETERVGPWLEGMGDHHHPITTNNPQTQKLFDQGMVLAYGFNHLEAERSFREAARLDPDCAMCYWGIAFVRGPNINSMMDPENVPVAFEAMAKAIDLAPAVSAPEQDYIQALALRYVEDPPADRSELDLDYADAMRGLAAKYPDDHDAATLFAASLMDTTPWDYWLDNGEPKPETREVMATLERVLDENPDHAGAAHFYIHIVEKERPKLAETIADNLGGLVPGAGHLVHMPSHIYLRVGRYHDATVANQKAIAADDSYITQCRNQGLYPVMYMPHNWHYIWYAASVEGRSEVALNAATEMASRVDLEKMRQPGLGAVQHYWITPLWGYIRFGKWDEILAATEPDEDLLYPRAVWHYARGLARVRQGELDQAEVELTALSVLAMEPELERVTVWDLNTTAALMDIAVEVLTAEIATARGDLDTAVDALTEAVELEDALNYDEPPPWYQPVRLTLGAVYLAADRPTDAERVYREDLETFPDNGWALFGLQQSLAAQGRRDEAAAVGDAFNTAWQYADVALESSRF